MDFSSSDKRWQKYNQKLQKLMMENDFFGLGTTYYEIAAFVEKEGKDPGMYRDLGYKMKRQAETVRRTLESWLESEVVGSTEICGTEDSCEYCKSLAGKKLSLEEAIENKPLPVKECTYKYGCRCVYLPVV